MAETDNWTAEPLAEQHVIAQATLDSPDVKLFGKWPLAEIDVNDISLVVCFGPYFLACILIHSNLGLHRREGEVGEVPPAQCWPLPDQALPQGHLPDRGAPHLVDGEIHIDYMLE